MASTSTRALSLQTVTKRGSRIRLTPPCRHVARRRLASSAPGNALTVLALESSADDSCAAIVTSAREILSSVVLKQHDLNRVHGGIHPIAAHEAHLINMPQAIRQCMTESKRALSDIDAIAYTRGPGMYGPLSVCAASARALAAATGKPLVGVHHMQAHALTPLLTEPVPPEFPFITLLVSGGHTMLVRAESDSKFSILAKSLDSAMGDAFDKFARLIHLEPHPARGFGAALEDAAARAPLPPFAASPEPPLKRPLSTDTGRRQLAFSFAGLLTAAEKRFRQVHADPGTRPADGVQREMARVFQDAAVGHVVQKVGDCLAGTAMRGLVVSGGVGSNLVLRARLQGMLDELSPGTKLYYPPVALCTDNAAMIAWAAIVRLQGGLISDPPSLPIRKKWSLEDLYNDVPADCYRAH